MLSAHQLHLGGAIHFQSKLLSRQFFLLICSSIALAACSPKTAATDVMGLASCGLVYRFIWCLATGKCTRSGQLNMRITNPLPVGSGMHGVWTTKETSSHLPLLSDCSCARLSRCKPTDILLLQELGITDRTPNRADVVYTEQKGRQLRGLALLSSIKRFPKI
jgi:hypothetical protein